MEGAATVVADSFSSPQLTDDANFNAAKQTDSDDAVTQGKKLHQRAMPREETKTGKDDKGEVDEEENEVLETERKKRKRKRSRKHRHSSKEDATDQPEVSDVNAASTVNDDSLHPSDETAPKQKDSTRQGQPKDRPRSAKGNELMQSQYPQQSDNDGRQVLGGEVGGAVGGANENRPMQSKGKSHKAEQRGGQTPGKTPKGKPKPETHGAGPKQDRPNSSKGRMNSNHVMLDQQKNNSTPNKDKFKGATARNTPNEARSSSKNQRDSPNNKHRTDAQIQQNIQNGEVQTPPRGDPRGQRTPGSEVSEKKAKTPKSKNRNRAGTSNKKNFKAFEDYLSLEAVSDGLKRKFLLQGTLRINPRNYEESYINSEDGEADIMMSGIRARNRALEGDVVVVELLDKSAWKLLEEDYQSHKKKKLKEARSSATASKPGTAAKTNSIAAADEMALVGELQRLEISETSGNTPSDGAIDLNAAGTTNPSKSKNVNSTFRVSGEKRIPAALRETNSDSEDVIVIRNSKLPALAEKGPQEEIDDVVKRLFPDYGNEDQTDEAGSDEKMKWRGEEEIPKRFFQKQGRVVYIIETRHSRASSGLLKPPTNSNATDALFSPTDHRMPRMYIPLGECPDGFLERPRDFETTLFIARLAEWPKTSAIARGHLHRSLGEAGEIEPETEGMLLENGVDYSDFSDEVIECLPKNLPWTIPQDEIAKRRDFRNQCVFTIDPATARDQDDALSCVPLGDGLYEVGVHIADVSFFVDEENALDTVAGLRATSVYLVQKVIPMLPRLLCEHLCSLNPNEDKLTFSFLWKLTEEGEITEEWCGRSIIRSCVKMSYDHAQGIIEEPERDWRQDEMPPIADGFAISDIAKGILNLNKIAQNLRKKRSEDGALRLDQVKLQYVLDRESGLPSGYSVYQQRDSNKLVEEFMLLANMAAAHRVHDYNRKTALLRRHPPPKAKMMEDLVGMCSDIGLVVDGSSSKSIQESLRLYLGPREDKKAWGKGQILMVMYSKPMQRAKYFCAGTLKDEVLYRHYALNVPLYTHFTSPIRRYADILVHRQLAASLRVGPVSERDTLAIQEQARRCNERKEAAKKVSDLSSEMFFAIFVRECGPLEEDAMVMQVLDRSIDVLVMNLGVVKRVYCNALPLKSFKSEKQGKQGRLTIVWEADEHHLDEPMQILQLFSLVKVELKAAKEPLKFTATIKRPEVE